MTFYGYRPVDPSEFDDTELGAEVRAAWADGVRTVELVPPRVDPLSPAAKPPPPTPEPLGTCPIHGDYWTDDCQRCDWSTNDVRF